jgi:hypothetical protein
MICRLDRIAPQQKFVIPAGARPLLARAAEGSSVFEDRFLTKLRQAEDALNLIRAWPIQSRVPTKLPLRGVEARVPPKLPLCGVEACCWLEWVQTLPRALRTDNYEG